MACRTPFSPTGDYTQTQPFHASYLGNLGPHLACDMVGRDGQIAVAINAGKVWQASWNGGGWAIGGGYAVIVYHGPEARPTMKSSYCHGKGLYVRPGQRILPGQRLIVCDNKGNSTGSHCHHTVELWDAGSGKWVAVDPHSVYPAHKWHNGSQTNGSRVGDVRALTAVRVTGSYVHLRADATTASAVLATLKAGTLLVGDGGKSGQQPAGFSGRWWNRGWWWNGSTWLHGYLHGSLSVRT